MIQYERFAVLSRFNIPRTSTGLEKIRNEQLQRYMTGTEHALLRETLQTAVRISDMDESTPDNNSNDNDSEHTGGPFYQYHVLSLINKPKREERIKQTKRKTFDSISHQGGFSGLRGYGFVTSGRQRKRPFTFRELLPYLINEMRRKSRDLSR